jgi:hypothetical protein
VNGAYAAIAGCSAFETSKSVGPALSGTEIKKLLGGNTIQGPLGPAVYDWYYTSDGKVSIDVDRHDIIEVWEIIEGNPYSM